MNILGISGGVKVGNQEGAAALLVDGRLVAAAEEERLVGISAAVSTPITESGGHAETL